jgi:hypothetical protein
VPSATRGWFRNARDTVIRLTPAKRAIWRTVAADSPEFVAEEFIFIAG